MRQTENPYIVEETGDFAVVWKPRRMHCAPLGKNGGTTLTEWYGNIFPGVFSVSGKKKGEGGLTHRLDFETEGLVLFAKNQRAFDSLCAAGRAGLFVKEYSALCAHASFPCPGFPPPPAIPGDLTGTAVESFFRPYGPGRKEVRPVTEMARAKKEIASDRGGLYRTEICGAAVSGGDSLPADYLFTVKIKRGFRHQIRCHLAWLGYPIAGDTLYGAGEKTAEQLALRSHGITFVDSEGRQREYRVAPLDLEPGSFAQSVCVSVSV